MDIYERMSDEELWDKIDKKYGKNWTLESLDPQDALAKEHLHRLTQAEEVVITYRDVAFKHVSDEELNKMLEKKYGNSWYIKDLPDDDPLVIEHFNRIAQGN